MTSSEKHPSGPRRRRPLRRLLVALALSLAVHGTGLFLLRKTQVPVPPSASTWVAELEIVERPAAAPPERPTSRTDRKISDRPGSVRITQGRSGHLVSAELISSFSDPGWDRGLLLDLTQAAHLLPEPPPEVFSEHRYLSSLWSFQYSPGALTDFDLVNLFDKRAIPKSDSKRVQLLSAEPSD